ncbi:MAG: transglutaminase-like domain-containing protein [Planctomycetota bacterium]
MTPRGKQIITALVIVLSLFVGNTFQTTQIVVPMSVIACCLAYLRKEQATESKTRSWWQRLFFLVMTILSIAAVFGLTSVWRIGNQFGDSFNFILVAIEILSHSFLFLILFAWILRPHRGHISMLPLGLLVVLLCAAAGGTSFSLTAQTSVALAAVVGFTLASQILLGVRRGTRGEVFAQLEPTGSHSMAPETRSWVGPVFSLMTLSVLTIATTTIANATNKVLPSIQSSLQSRIQRTFDPSEEEKLIGGTRYVSGSSLGSVRRHMLGSPQEIALRVHCEVTPGYLRGTVFDFYDRRRWRSAAHGIHDGRVSHPSFQDRLVRPTGPATTSLVEPSSADLSRFPIAGSQSDRVVTVEVHNTPMKGSIVFLPMNARWLEAVSRQVEVSSHNVIRAGTIEVEHPYIGGIGLTPVREPLAPFRREQLLRVPSRVQDIASQIVSEVCRDMTSPRAKATAIRNYFRKNYSYSLDVEAVEGGIDPIDYFLREKPDAHCEYFASATVMLLRQAGVPARYVTGYSCTEYDDDALFWVARNRDAHAWAEAYDSQTQQWFPVESTPNRTYQTVELDEEDEEDASLFDVFGNDDDSGDESLIGRIAGWILSFRLTDPLFLVFRFAQWPLLFGLMFYLWTRRRQSVQTGEAAVDYQSHKMLKKVDRRLRRYSMVRRSSETLFQFSDRIESQLGDTRVPLRDVARQQLQEAADWYRNYANARYQGEMPEPLL